MFSQRTVFLLSSLMALSWGGCTGETCAGGEKQIDGECPCSDGTARVGGECPCEDGSYPADNPEGVCAVGTPPDPCDAGFVEVDGECLFECDDGSTTIDEFECPVAMEPVAVGIEYVGGFIDGEFAPFGGQDTTGAIVDIEPRIFLTMADIESFSGGGYRCTVTASVVDVLTTGTSIPTVDGATLWYSWDMALQLDAASWEEDLLGDGSCADIIDPDLFGPGGQDLFAAFDGIHLGIGFGASTTNLVESLGEAFVTDVGADALFTHYVAINDAGGAWIGEDWVGGVSYAWDETTHVPLFNEAGALMPQPLAGTTVPNGIVLGTAWWYQDFPLMDLTNLSDGAP